jgi:hypothetical protein
MTDPKIPEEVVERLFVALDRDWAYEIGTLGLQDILRRLTPADLSALVEAIMPGHVVVPRERLAKLVLKVSECPTSPLPCTLEPTKHNEMVWSAGQAAGCLLATEEAQKVVRAMIEAAQASEAGDG